MSAQRRRKARSVEASSEIVASELDERVVDSAVSAINHILRDTMYKALTSVGDYVFRVFFHSDPELVASKDPNKAISFRALAERCGSDLPISKSWLHNAVRVAAMRRALPERATFKQLPPSHQTALLPVRDPRTAERLAKRAIVMKLSVRDLREAVVEALAQSREDDAPRGRPRKPTITKTLDRATKVFTLDGGRRSFTKAMLDELDEEEIARALKAARALIDRLDGLVAKLEGLR